MPSIDVWVVRVSGEGVAPGGDASLAALAQDERERAARFRFDRDRHRFVVAHAALRQILVTYIGAEAARTPFATTEHGKPFLPGHPVHFNLSHAGNLALVAVTREGPIGVDVEEIRPLECDRLATRFFSVVEQRSLLDLAPERRLEAFFTCWARKEAFIKAVGEGLSLPLADFDVAFAPGEACRLLAVRRPGQDAADWSLAPVEVDAGYQAAVAAPWPGAAVRRLDWEPAAGQPATRNST